MRYADKNLTMLKYNGIAEENTCMHFYKGYCVKINECCPSIVRYDDNNNNNVPCDLTGYKPMKECCI